MLNASLTDPDDDDDSLPFHLRHLIWNNDSSFTSRFAQTLFSHSASSITTLTLDFTFPGLPLDRGEDLLILFPHLRHLKLHSVRLFQDDFPFFSSCTRLETLSCTPAPASWAFISTSVRPLLDVLPVKLRELSLGGEEGAKIARMTPLDPLLDHPTLSELKVLHCEGKPELRRLISREVDEDTPAEAA